MMKTTSETPQIPHDKSESVTIDRIGLDGATGNNIMCNSSEHKNTQLILDQTEISFKAERNKSIHFTTFLKPKLLSETEVRRRDKQNTTERPC